MQQVTLPTRKNNILDLTFTLALLGITTNTRGHFPGNDHGTVTCNLSTPSPQKYNQTTIGVPTSSGVLLGALFVQ